MIDRNAIEVLRGLFLVVLGWFVLWGGSGWIAGDAWAWVNEGAKFGLALLGPLLMLAGLKALLDLAD
jgi:hypothetical protein